jgi:S1-C subfamily serine protease
VALVIALNKDWEPSYGTGVAIDDRHILTAYHVVKTDRLIGVLMPARRPDGGIDTDEEACFARPVLHCVVVARDAKRDLALLRVKQDRPGLKPLPLAARAASPGAAVFTIGSSPGDGSLWRFSGGHVRQVYDARWTFDTGQAIEARAVEMTIPINPGDSGGPIIDRSGAVVGINSASVEERNQVHKGIDITEIRAFVTEALAEKRGK